MTCARLSLAGFALAALSACPPPPVDGPDAGADAGQQPPLDGGFDAGQPVDAGDPSAVLFDPDHLVDVRIELPVTDWDTLRNQTRDLFTLLAGDCTAQPFPSPFTTFESTVTVDGTRLPRSSIKKKGFLGSLSANRPSLKLKFDAFVMDQVVSGQDAMTLNNAQQDPSVVRQCLGYALFARAGLIAPRCNYAQVFVNGVDLGVYVHVEGIDKDFLSRHFAKKSGNLYEGTLSDFNSTLVRTFDLKDAKIDRSDLDAVLAALNGPDADLEARLATVMNVDQFIDFWAMETLVRHWDGYSGNTNNFFIYDDPTAQRFFFIPWGADAVFHTGPVTPGQPEGPLLNAELPRRFFAVPALRDRYLARVRTFLDTVFSEAQLDAEITRMQALIVTRLHPIQASQFATGIADLRRFVANRRARLLPLLANPPAPPSGARSPPCLARLGTFHSEFSTTWGTLGAPNPFITGPATFELAIDGGPGPFFLTGASAGLDTQGNDGAKSGINLVAAQTDAGFTAVALRFDPSLWPPPNGAPQTFDLFSKVGYVIQFAGGQGVPIGLLGQGTVTFTDAGVTDGGAVAGTIDTQVFSWPFGGGM
jgi:hypothetical protein